MKKEGRSEMVGRGIAGEYCSPDTWRPTSWAVGCGLVGLGGGRKNGNDEDKSGERKRGLWLRASWEVVEHVMAVLLLLLPPSSQFHFHGL